MFPQSEPPRRLTEAERAIVLDLALMPRSSQSFTVSSNGHVSTHGPRIRRLSSTSATVAWRTQLLDPLVILGHAALVVITCGAWTVVWFLLSLRKPGVRRVWIDEWGNQQWSEDESGPGHYALRVTLAVLVAVWVVAVVFAWAVLEAAMKAPTPGYGQ